MRTQVIECSSGLPRRYRFASALLSVLCLLSVFLTAQSGAAQGSSQLPTKSHENVIYGMHGGLALLMDVYQPEASNGRGLLLIFGSGWQSPPGYDGFSIKDVSPARPLVGPLLEQGFTVFAINHRTAPLYRYPAAVEDAQRAVRFIRNHAQEYGVTSDKIAAMGHSSGGHLVLMLALNPQPGDPSARDPVERERAGVEAVVALAGPTDLTAADLSPWSAEVVASFIGQMKDYPGFANLHEEASPVTYVDAGDPPVFLIHGTDDPIVPVTQAQVLRDALEAAQVECRYVEVEGAGHGTEVLIARSGQQANSVPFEQVTRWLLDRTEQAEEE